MTVAETRELGTIFTADVLDFIKKTRMVRQEIAKFYAAQNKIKIQSRAMAASQQALGVALDKVGKAAKRSADGVDSLASKQKVLSGAVGGVDAVAQKTAGSLGNLTAKQRELSGAVSGVGIAAKKAVTGLGDLASKHQAFSGAVSGVGVAAKQTTGSLNTLTSVQREHGKQLGHIKSGWEQVKGAMRVTASYGVASAAIFGVVSALRAGVVEIAVFDQALKNFQAVSQATDSQVAAASEVARKIATETKYSATEVAQGMVLLSQAGLSAAESIGVIGATSTLATGTLENFEKTADLMTTTLVSFNMRASESSKVADLMANAINKSKLTVEKLRVVFGYVGAAAHQAGLSLEQLGAVTMVLANNGLRASTIATGLRQVLARMLSPGAKLRQAFKDFNIELDKVNPSLVGFEQSMKNLAPILVDPKTKVVDMSKAFELFGLRGGQSAAIIAHAFSTGSFEEAIATLYRTGSAAEMAAKQKEGLGVSAKNLADRMRNLAISLGDAGVKGALVGLVDSIASAVDAMDSFVRSVKGEVLVNLALWTAAIGTLIWTTSKLWGLFKVSATAKLIADFALLAPQIGGVTTAFLTLKAVMVAHPIMTLALVIGGLMTTLKYFEGAIDRNIKKTAKMAERYTETATSMRDYRDQIQGMADQYGNTETAGREYEALLTRLKEAHPELTRAINENKDSFSGLITVMDRAARTPWLKSLEEQVRLMGLQYQKLMKIKQDFELYANNSYPKYLLGATTSSTMDQFISASKEGKQVMDNLQTQASEIARTIYDQFKDKKNFDGVQRMAKALVANIEIPGPMMSSSKLDDNAMKMMLDMVYKELEIFKKTVTVEMTGVEKEIKKTVDTLPQLFSEYYRSLSDPLDKSNFIDAVMKFNKEIAETEKRLKNTSDPAEEIDRILNAEREAFMEEYKLTGDQQARMLQLKKQYQTKMAALETDERKKIDERKQAALDEADTWYQKQRVADIRNGQDSAETETKYAQLKNQIAANAAREHLNLDQELGRKRIEINKKQNDILLEQERQLAIQSGMDKGDSEDEIKTKQLQAAADAARVQYEVEQKTAEQTRRLYGERSGAALDALSRMYGAELSYHQSVTALQAHTAGVTRKRETDEGMARLKSVRKFSEQWLNVLNELHDKGIVGEEKYQSEIAGLMKHQDKEEADRLKARLRSVSKYSEEWFRILDEVYALEGMSAERRTQEINRAYKEMFEEIEKGYRAGAVSVEAYMDAINKAVEHQVLLENEANERRIMANGTMWEQFQLGMRKASEGYQTWGEFVTGTSEQLAGIMSDNLTGGLFDFIDGTKSASQAMADFAENTLRWLSEMIVKWALFKAITGMLGGADTSTSTLDSSRYTLGYQPDLSGGIGFAKGGLIEKPKGFWSGGLIGRFKKLADGGTIPGISPTPTADNIPIMATAGEYMQSVPAVKYYGESFMEAINRMLIPRDFLRGFGMGGFVSRPSYALASGGSVPQRPLGNGVNMYVNVVNHSDAQVTAKSRETQNGVELDIMIDKVVANKLGNRGNHANKTLRQNFNVRERLTRR